MLHWNKKYSLNRATMTAHTDTGHTLTIISTGIPNPVQVYETAPGDKSRTRFATVPSIELAMLAAEERNLVNLRATAGSPEEPLNAGDERAARARSMLDHLESGPKDYFIIEVPKVQSLTAQRTLELVGLHLRMAPSHPNPAYRIPAIVPQTRIYEAAVAVNADLQRDHLQPLLRLPPTIGETERPGPWLEFFHQEYLWGRNVAITGRLWQMRGERWQDVAARYPQTLA